MIGPQLDWLALLAGYGRQFEWWVLLSSVPVKAAVIRWLTGFPPGGSALYGIGLGLLAAVLAVRLPLGVVLWILGPGWIAASFGIDSIHPLNWLGMAAATAVVSMGGDLLFLRVLLGRDLGVRTILLLAGINAVCLAFACFETTIYVDEHPPEARLWDGCCRYYRPADARVKRSRTAAHSGVSGGSSTKIASYPSSSNRWSVA